MKRCQKLKSRENDNERIRHGGDENEIQQQDNGMLSLVGHTEQPSHSDNAGGQ